MKASSKMSIEERVDAVNKHIVSEVFRIIDTQKDSIGSVQTVNLICQIVESIIASTVYGVLETAAKSGEKNKKTQYALVEKNFKTAKLSMQDAVASAFSQAMTKFTNKDVEYYCQLTTVGEPINKRPC